jgi:hypothetical protein
MRTVGGLLALVPVLFGLTGCTQGLEARTFQTRVIHAASADEVFRAAQVILRREFGRLQVDSEGRRIVAEPVEYRTSSESGTARDLYGGRSTMRRTADFVVTPRSDGAVARLRIGLERQDTARREVFRPEHGRFSDAPGQRTAIERDAATSTQQNTVWTFVKRDRRLERALLEELQEQFAPESEEIPATQPAPEHPAEAS